VPRTGASPADLELIAHAESRGFTLTGRRIERWRAQGLLPANVRRALGRGRGSTSEPAPGARDLVLWLAEHARSGRRPGDLALLALLAFGAGLAVPENAARAAFVEAADRLEINAERYGAPGTAPEDIADAAVAAGLHATVVPARVRRIDAALVKLGVNWSAPELIALDPGSGTDAATVNEWMYASVHMLLTGVAGIDMATIGRLARSTGPVGGAAPLAGQVEYRWPGNHEQADPHLTDNGGLDFLPEGDLRVYLRDLAATTAMKELLEAWRAAAQAGTWANDLCDAVEREIAAREPGEAMKEWFLGAFGPPRLMIITALRHAKPRPIDLATNALGLILIRGIIRNLRQLLPEGRFDLLANPAVAPPFLRPFMTS